MDLKFDSIIKIAGILIAGVSFFVGLRQYSINNEREYRKSLFTEQIKFYEQLLDDLGSLKYSMEDSTTVPEFQKSYGDFKKLYYGNLNLYQDNAIEASSDSLFNKIESLIQEHDLKLIKDTGAIKQSVDSIQNNIYELARLCNLSLQRTYGVDLNDSK